MADTTKNAPIASLSIFERRRVEAQMLKNIYDVLVERHGKKEAEEVLGVAVIRAAQDHGKDLREQHGSTPDLQDFADLLPLWKQGGALEMDMLDVAAEKLDFNVTRCAYAEMYQEMGLRDIGHLLSCNRDGSFCEGYNPDMNLTRTQTIMQGATHCDFRFTMDKKPG